MLSGHGLSRSAWSRRGSLSAKRMDRPSMVRTCGWIDWLNVVGTGSLLHCRRITDPRARSPAEVRLGCCTQGLGVSIRTDDGHGGPHGRCGPCRNLSSGARRSIGRWYWRRGWGRRHSRNVCRRLDGHLAKRPEPGADLLAEELRLLPGRKVPAFVELVVMNELGIRPLGPAPWGRKEVVREGAHGDRDVDAFDIEKAEPALQLANPLPVETARGDSSGRQPEERDIVEDIVSGKARGLSGKGARDQLQAAGVVIEEVGREADGRIRNAVERLRAQPHLVGIADALRIDEGQPLVREFLVG